MLKANERKLFEKLLDDPNFKGKKPMRFVFWLNTTEPKFKAGDVVRFSSKGLRIYGRPARNIVGVVKDTYTMYDCYHYNYHIECKFEVPGKVYETDCVTSEEFMKIESASDGINHNWKVEDEHPESISVSVPMR